MMKNDMIIEEIHNIAKSENVSVFVIGQATEMSNERSGYRPEDFIPGAQSVICFGIPVPKGIYSTTNYNLEAAWRSQNLLYRRLDMLALRISTLLEENGAGANPIYRSMPIGVYVFIP